MERLTQNNFDYCLEMCEPETQLDCAFYMSQTECVCGEAAIYNKLREYENAEQEGRLVVLPCKPDVTCKHAQGEIYINAIGEACLYCDIWDGQRNISLGECIGNCDCAEAEKAMEVSG